jgi:EAL domain-containing protein (putative c-di-GMP-specific phosphodiesterase class I)/ActR/RegA family two-component response regulator
MPHALPIAPASSPASPGLLAPQHLLVIDDQRLDRAITSHAARCMGFQVQGASSIAETRDLLERGAVFDFAVLDLALGNEDGLEVLPLLARCNPAAIVILASGFNGRILAASQRLAVNLGVRVAGVLRKPILPTALQRIIGQAPGVLFPDDDTELDIAPERIRRALAEGQIRPWFQPKTSLATGLIVGTEALARWVQPDGRSIPPALFVAVAERNGLIGELTDAMLDQALRACAHWRARRPDCWLAVNLSPLLLNDPGLTDRIERRLEQHGVPPGALVLEITESNGIPDSTCAIRNLTRLRIRGVNLSIDDFGTGHSSMLSLIRMPFNEMKIDQAFVRESVTSRDSRKVVRASATLGRELGLKVVAEGVETEAMAQLVEDAGCHVGQGFLYGRAVPADIFEAELTETAAQPSVVPVL